MKQFFKFVTASCLGVFLAIAVIFGAFMIIGSVLAGKKPSISKHSVLKIDMNRVVPERTNNVETQAFNLEPGNYIGLRDIKNIIEYAATDSKIDGIYISNSSVSIGQASLSSIRESIEEFKASGKFVYAYADYMTQSAYYLASVADSVYLNPNGAIDIKGYGTMIPFFKDMLDNVGVKMNIFYAGDFKSATEPLRGMEMSEPNKIQTRAFLNDMLDIYMNDVAESRNISVSDVNSIMSGYKGKSAKSALEAGLIDGILYQDQMEDILRGRTDKEEDDKVKYVTLDKYSTATTIKDGDTSNDEIAIVYAEGTVNYGSEAKGEINESIYLKALEKIENDDDIKAVVLRVNSGGGSSLTSDIIWRAIENIKAKGKPVIASFGDMAASGGYYIAAGADTIVAQPNTLTGSIGVFSFFPNARELMENKLGIAFDTLKTHPMAVAFSTVYDLSDKESTLMQEGVDDIYQTFLKRVADGRGMTVDAVHEVAQGRVWTGSAAINNGLVDVLGDLDDAVDIAASAAGIDGNPKIKSYPYIQEKFIDQLMKGLAESGEISVLAKSALNSQEYQLLKNFKEIRSVIEDQSPQARMPYIFTYD